MSILQQLEFPEKAVFPDTAPRYPNLWMYLHESLCSNYGDAVRLMMQLLQECTDMHNDFGFHHVAEGCDAFARRRGLQPVSLGPDGSRSHDHCVHFRFYSAPLRMMPTVTMDGETYFRTAASIHYEVDRPQPLHPYVDECPYCGCTGEYAQYMGGDNKIRDEQVHDPLGVEIVLHGTIRGEKIVAFEGLNSLADRFDVRLEEQRLEREDINTPSLGLVFLKRKAQL